MSENTLEDSFEKVSISEKDGDKSENQNSKGFCDKREDYLPWEDYFLAVAFLSAMRSKDPSTQVVFIIYKKMFRGKKDLLLFLFNILVYLKC